MVQMWVLPQIGHCCIGAQRLGLNSAESRGAGEKPQSTRMRNRNALDQLARVRLRVNSRKTS
ncbi:uncharacterized protein PG986_006876 [Apiospora aurea]|uniref:Uncharacterized protein n=1 Tax=Apiospora aurea TaxID=335848 RepID=A0ABR1QB15_9PEZI